MSRPVERIRDEHPHGPLFRAWQDVLSAQRRGDKRSLGAARKKIGAVRHELMCGRDA